MAGYVATNAPTLSNEACGQDRVVALVVRRFDAARRHSGEPRSRSGGFCVGRSRRREQLTLPSAQGDLQDHDTNDQSDHDEDDHELRHRASSSRPLTVGDLRLDVFDAHHVLGNTYARAGQDFRQAQRSFRCDLPFHARGPARCACLAWNKDVFVLWARPRLAPRLSTPATRFFEQADRLGLWRARSNIRPWRVTAPTRCPSACKRWWRTRRPLFRTQVRP